MTEPDAQRKATVEAFLRDPKHLSVDDGSALDHPTGKPELYRLPAVQRRLLPVLTLLPADVFLELAHDRNLLILASASPREPWTGPPDVIDPVAHGAYAARGRNPQDPVMWALERPPFSWVIKLARIEMELAPRQAFAGIVIHECMHSYLDHDFGARTVDRAAVQRAEDEAVESACELGFRRQTAAYLKFYATRFPRADVIMGRLPA
jgi:hypothetical protein